MSGTIQGGRLAATTNKKLYGKDFYHTIGAKGGKTPTKKPKGFAAMDKEKLKLVSKKGGTNSKRVFPRPLEPVTEIPILDDYIFPNFGQPTPTEVITTAESVNNRHKPSLLKRLIRRK